jgi:hypothetical protein
MTSLTVRVALVETGVVSPSGVKEAVMVAVPLALPVAVVPLTAATVVLLDVKVGVTVLVVDVPFVTVVNVAV